RRQRRAHGLRLRAAWPDASLAAAAEAASGSAAATIGQRWRGLVAGPAPRPSLADGSPFILARCHGPRRGWPAPMGKASFKPRYHKPVRIPPITPANAV